MLSNAVGDRLANGGRAMAMIARALSAAVVLGLGFGAQSHATSIAMADVTGLRLQISGLQTGSCGGNGSAGPSGHGAGGGVASVGAASCTRVGDAWVFEGSSFSAFASVPDPVFPGSQPRVAGDSIWTAYASWHGQPGIIPGALSGTSLSFDLSLAYSYETSVTGFERPPPNWATRLAGSEAAYVVGSVYVEAIYDACGYGGYCYEGVDDIFVQKFFEASIGTALDQPFSESRFGEFDRIANVVTDRDYKRFHLGIVIAATAVQHYYTVPEPVALPLLSIAFAALAFARRRRVHCCSG